MAGKKGRCVNIDCEHYKEVIEIPSGEEFVCPSCGQQLKVCDDGKSSKKSGGGNKKRNIIIAAIAAVVVAIIAIVLCVMPQCSKGKTTGPGPTGPEGGPEPTSIELNHTKMTLKVGETDELEVTNLADGDEAVYKVSKNKVVSVDQDGVVTALKEGEGKVLVKLKGNDSLNAVCVYTVIAGDSTGTGGEGGINVPKAKPVVGLTLDKTKLTLKAGAKAQISVTVENKAKESALSDDQLNKLPVTWSSSNSKVAAVDNNGNVTAKSKGSATIKAEIKDTTITSTPATCAVTVTQGKDDGGGGGSGPGTKNLGYGIYRGDLKNGKPHGHGIITYTKQHRIVSSKDFVANPGDRFEGDFRDGQIESIGYWYHDGQQTGIKP